LGYIWALETGQNQRPHFHLVLISFDPIIHPRDRMMLYDGPLYAPPLENLLFPEGLALFAYLRRMLETGGFGIAHIQPLRKNADALAYYLVKQFVKNWHHFQRKTKERLRLWQCSTNLRVIGSQFCFLTPGEKPYWALLLEEAVRESGYDSIELLEKVHPKFRQDFFKRKILYSKR